MFRSRDISFFVFVICVSRQKKYIVRVVMVVVICMGCCLSWNDSMLVIVNFLVLCISLVISSKVMSQVMRNLIEQRNLLQLLIVMVLQMFRNEVVERQLFVMVKLFCGLVKECLVVQQLVVVLLLWFVWMMMNSVMVMNVRNMEMLRIGLILSLMVFVVV